MYMVYEPHTAVAYIRAGYATNSYHPRDVSLPGEDTCDLGASWRRRTYVPYGGQLSRARGQGQALSFYHLTIVSEF